MEHTCTCRMPGTRNWVNTCTCTYLQSKTYLSHDNSLYKYYGIVCVCVCVCVLARFHEVLLCFVCVGGEERGSVQFE